MVEIVYDQDDGIEGRTPSGPRYYSVAVEKGAAARLEPDNYLPKRTATQRLRSRIVTSIASAPTDTLPRPICYTAPPRTYLGT